MLIKVGRVSEIPEGVIRLSREEAIEEMNTIVKNYKPLSEKFFFAYGPWILSATSGIAGFRFLTFFRKQYRLAREDQFSTYLPTIAIPTLLTYLGHNAFVNTPILLQERICPVCLEIRGGAVQVLVGTVWTVVLAGLGSTFSASRTTFHVPSFLKDPKEYFKFLNYIVKPGYKLFSTFAVFQFAFGMFGTYLEGRSFDVMLRRLQVQDNLARNERLSDRRV